MSQPNAKDTYRMITMCNKDNRSTLMLTQSHGKHVYAESLQRDDKNHLAKAIGQEMTLVTRLLVYSGSSGCTAMISRSSLPGSSASLPAWHQSSGSSPIVVEEEHPICIGAYNVGLTSQDVLHRNANDPVKNFYVFSERLARFRSIR